jgi:hypothetical protein
MSGMGRSNPLKNFERRMSPAGMRGSMRPKGFDSGLGSLRRTMPHLRPAVRLQGGGSLNPVGDIYAASRPNLYNPDPQYRRVLAAIHNLGSQYSNPAMHAFPGSTLGLPYADGGEAPDDEPMPDEPRAGGDDLQELMNPDDQMSESSDDEKQIVQEALLALEGRHPNPKQALKLFVDTFGPEALKDLQYMAQGQGEDDEEDDEDQLPDEGGGQEEEEPDELEAAGGGLLNGPGSGQSDEIEGTTPSGRPVLLSDGEYVIDAPTVAALGDGSTSAGARRLDEMRKSIRKAAYGNDKQAKPMKNGGKAVLINVGK